MEDADEHRRLSTLDLVGLAAGGVIGSGWLLSGAQINIRYQGSPDWLTQGSWLIGGVVMLLIAAVMVELGIALPKTGGLIFLPLQAAGPLLATVVAAGLWIAYAVNPPSEAAAMVRALAHGEPELLSCKEGKEDILLSATGWLCAIAFMALIVGLNFLPPRRLIRLNLYITGVKVLILTLIIVGLGTDWFPQSALSDSPDSTEHLEKCLWRKDTAKDKTTSSLLGSAIIFSYIGFQAPLDCAGNVKRRGMGEAARLRWAVYGSLVGAFVLYTALQWVFDKHSGIFNRYSVQSPYAQIADSFGMDWLVVLIVLNALLSPLGAGIVFTYALTREVAALSRAHLTHRGLQTARRASFRFRGAQIDAYWMILLVNCVIGLVLLAVVQGVWDRLMTINSVLILLAYAMSGVVLVALKPPRSRGKRRTAHLVLSYAAFISIAVVIYEAKVDKVWHGMTALAVGTALLLGLPRLARLDLPVVGRLLRRYDARDQLSRFSKPADAAVRPALLFLTYLTVLLVCTKLGDFGKGYALAAGVAAAVAAAIVFPLLVRACRRYLEDVPRALPSPRQEPRPKSSVTEGT
ncbi:APC family permease [Streptomyces sp. NPDC002643]